MPFIVLCLGFNLGHAKPKHTWPAKFSPLSNSKSFLYLVGGIESARNDISLSFCGFSRDFSAVLRAFASIKYKYNYDQTILSLTDKRHKLSYLSLHELTLIRLLSTLGLNLKL